MISFVDVGSLVVVGVVDDADVIDVVGVVDLVDVVDVVSVVEVLGMVVLGVVERAFVIGGAVVAATSCCDLLLPVQEILLASAALQRS